MDNQNLIHNLDNNTGKTFSLPQLLIVLAVCILVGGLIGFIGSRFKSTSASTESTTQTAQQGETVTSAGIADTETFPDKAEGILREGGIGGEGSHHIEQKPGDKSQNAYVTSTTVDLSQFVGKKVRVMGKTYQAQQAGWLMDVGYIEVLQ